MTAIARLLPRFPAYSTPLDKLGWWAVRVVCVGVLGFLLLPILVIIPLSFSESSFLVYPIPGWSLKWYHNLFESAEWARAAKNSFIIAPAATVLATALGTLAAVGLVRTDFPVQGLADEPADRADGRAHRGRRRQHVPVLRAARHGRQLHRA